MVILNANDYYRSASLYPWETATGLVRLAPHCWYVGQEWVGVILIETMNKDGIIMIDSGIRGQMWQIFECIRKLGYDPEKDIKLCMLSHAHLDHCSGMPLLLHYCHPVMYMSPYEVDWLTDPKRWARYSPIDEYVPFEPDRLYDYKTPIECGGFTFHVKHTPGHTPGTSSYFFDDVDEDGTVYHIGLHGGMGINVLTDANYGDGPEEAARAKQERGAFRRMMEGLMDIPVDITISNHGPNIELTERLGPDKTDFHNFVDPSYWAMHLRRQLKYLDDVEAASKFNQ